MLNGTMGLYNLKLYWSAIEHNVIEVLGQEHIFVHILETVVLGGFI